jgi:ferrous iron transport protein B
MRYLFIDKLCADTVVKPKEIKQHVRSVKIDNVLTHKVLAIPIFLVFMGLTFWLTFGVIGSLLSELTGKGIAWASETTRSALTADGFNPVMISLVVDGIFAGVGSVLSFVPTIVVLFFFLSILEDSGYMARVAFVMDKLLRKIGLSGRSFVPMLVGFGCSVPAIMATRTSSSERDRKMTILLVPFMSCSAKLPIYGMFTMAFFPNHRALVMICLYVLGMLLGVISGLIFNKTIYRGLPVPFIMELPNYRLPNTKTVLLLLWEKAKDFLTRAFTVIFIATLVIWFLQTFDTRFNVVAEGGTSMLVGIGKLVAPFFAPLGFADWRAATALISGFMAKEAVISTFAVLTGSSAAELPKSLGQIFSPLAAISFLVFTLIYSPCVAAISAVNRELHSVKAAVGIVLYQTAVAWVAAFIVFQAGSLFL